MSDNFDLLNWIETGTNTYWEVTLYNDLALAGKLDALDKQYREAAKQEGPRGQQSLGEKSELDQIEAEISQVLERWEQSKTVWKGRGLIESEVDEIVESLPLPSLRPEPRRGQYSTERAYVEAHEAWTQDVAQVERAQQQIQDERNFRFIATATELVEAHNGSTTQVSPEMIKALKAKPHGPQAVTSLLNAVNEATTGEAQVEVPKSLRDSGISLA